MESFFIGVYWIIDKILALYIAVMRGVPLVVQLLIMAFVIMAGFPNKVIVCCIAMGLNSAAYVSEVVRGGINSVDAGQTGGRTLPGRRNHNYDYLHHPSLRLLNRPCRRSATRVSRF